MSDSFKYGGRASDKDGNASVPQSQAPNGMFGQGQPMLNQMGNNMILQHPQIQAQLQSIYMHPNHMQLINQFWQNTIQDVRNADISQVLKSTAIPLARVKKVMKCEEDQKQKMMISSEAPALLSKACEIFILELTLRSWIHTEENKRRTLQRSDIATAIQRYDTFDFLIDIVPREDANPLKTHRQPTEMMSQMNNANEED